MASRYYVITGGTMVHVAPHFSLTAPAYGRVGHQIAGFLSRVFRLQSWPSEGIEQPEVVLLRTNMARSGESRFTAHEEQVYEAAGIKFLETNEDLEKLIDYLILQPETKCIVMAAAVCDWKPVGLEGGEASSKNLEEVLGGMLDPAPSQEFGKQRPRLQTKHGGVSLHMQPADKLIGKIRKVRKDIFLVGFKATTGMEEQEQYITGLGLLKGASCNLVLANDVHEHRNMVITPEEAKYHVTKDRKAALKGLCQMIALRSQLHFTRSEVVEGDPIPWESDKVPANLRKVVNHLIKRGAYKPFQGKTVGHFATRGPRDGTIYTSRRKTDFNRLPEDGLLQIDTIGEDRVIAHGAKPSVGGQSQRIIFDEHRDVDCIVHAHVPLRPGVNDRRAEAGFDPIPVRQQRPYECGSHECGKNTSDGLQRMNRVPGVLQHIVYPDGSKVSGEKDLIKAVMLEEHGPNICFSKDTDPDLVIAFIEEFWDLEAKTGGPVSLEVM